MSVSLLDTFRALSSFAPPRVSLKTAPWEQYVDWAIGQGLAPLAAYNLEYRLGGADAPEWVRDRLLSIYQGSVNDNVMKLVAFKRAVGSLEGRKVLLVGGASFAEALYPHVGFRPVLEVSALISPDDLAPVTQHMARHDFRPEPRFLPDFPGAAQLLTEGHTPFVLYSTLLGERSAPEEAAVFQRALPMRVYGPSIYRLDLEDALLMTCLEQAQAGYESPLLTFVDLRELLLGAPSVGGPYSRPWDAAAVLARAKAWRLERALYVSMSVLVRLFPETGPQVQAVLPPLRPATRRLLDAAAVEPLSAIGQQRTWKGLGRLRRLLAAR